MEFARWIRDTGKYIWSQFIKLKEEDQGRFRKSHIAAPEVFGTMEAKMGEIWRKMLLPDFGRWIIVCGCPISPPSPLMRGTTSMTTNSAAGRTLMKRACGLSNTSSLSCMAP